MSEDKPPRVLKYWLECLGMAVTILASIVGLYVAMRPSAAPSNPKSVDASTNTQITPQPLPQTTMSSPTADSIPANVIGDSYVPAPTEILSSATISQPVGSSQLQDVQNLVVTPSNLELNGLDELLRSFPISVMDLAVETITYRQEIQACELDLAIRLNRARYTEFLAQIRPFVHAHALQPAAGTKGRSESFDVIVKKPRNVPQFEFKNTATRAAKDLIRGMLQAKPRRGEVVVPRWLLAISSSGSSCDEGCTLPTELWEIPTNVGQRFLSMFQQAENLKISVSLQNDSGQELTRATRSLALPYEGTWDERRFLQPAAPIGYDWSLQQGHFAPIASMDKVHRKDNAANRVFAILPGFISTPTRSEDEKSGAKPDFLDTVTLRLKIPVASRMAQQVASAKLSLVD